MAAAETKKAGNPCLLSEVESVFQHQKKQETMEERERFLGNSQNCFLGTHTPTRTGRVSRTGEKSMVISSHFEILVDSSISARK